MDRSDEFRKVAAIFETPNASKEDKLVPTDDITGLGDEATKPIIIHSPIVQLAIQTYANLYENEDLVKKMDRYAGMKEFSNDPTKQMMELSTLFESKVHFIQRNLQQLKLLIDKSTDSSQNVQHYRLIYQYISKLLSNQSQIFKNALKVHKQHIDERNKRVEKFGGSTITPSSSVGASAPLSNLSSSGGTTGALLAEASSQYAMFQTTGPRGLPQRFPPAPAAISAGPSSIPSASDRAPGANVDDGIVNRSAFRNRKMNSNTGPSTIPVTNSGSSSSVVNPYSAAAAAGGNSNSLPPMQSSAVQGMMKKKDDYRLKQAQQAEQSIKQMGQLFSQMASLIAEQSEVIMRIEDDVEAGLQNTIEGNAHIQNVYEITKGNRSMILKVFLLLVFFIFLFLVWT